MYKFLIPLVILNILSQNILSQTKPEIEWEKTYGGYTREELTTILPTVDNGYLIGGPTMSSNGDIKSGNKGWFDFWVVKINQDGGIIWEKTYGTIGSDYLNVIQQASDGGFILGGYTNMINENQINPQQGIHDFLIYKIDNKGNLIWKKTFGGTGDDVLNSIQPTQDGGFLLGGTTNSIDGDVQSRKNQIFNFFEKDMWLIKIDKNGNLQWEKTFGENYSFEVLMCIYQVKDGYLLGGSSSRNKKGEAPLGVNGPSNFCLIKIDFAGNILWENRYGGSGNEVLVKILDTNDGGYLLAGRTTSVDGDIQSRTRKESYYWDLDYWVVKVDDSGNMIWEKSYGDIGWDVLYSCCNTSNGGYILAGVTDTDVTDINSENPAKFDCWIINIDSIGNVIWNAKYGGSEDDAFTTILPINNNKYLLGGDTKSNDGDIRSGNHGAQNSWTHGRLDFWVMKYNSNLNLSTEEITNTTNIYPNPVKDKLITNYNKEGIVSIFDLFGKLLLKQNVTNYNQVIDVSFIPSGTYIINFNSKNQYESSKLIKL